MATAWATNSINCRGAAGIEILDTYDPSIVSDPVRIDSTTGEVRWEVPKNVGQYNFALLVSEYRIGPLGSWEFMGSVTRDLQVDIDQCNNNPPVLDPLGPFCVVAGKTSISWFGQTIRTETASA